MIKTVIDFETRSEVELKTHGGWRYAMDPSTDVLCIAFRTNHPSPHFRERGYVIPEEPVIEGWKPRTLGLYGPEDMGVLVELLLASDEVEAHNAEFERALWKHIVHKRWGYPLIPLEQWRCSAAVAAYRSLPRSLDKVGEVLNLPAQKDMAGSKTMLKFAKPRKPTKANPDRWHTDLVDFTSTVRYCCDDVEAEWALSERLGPLPEHEQKTWQLDQRINERGVYVDIPSCHTILQSLEKDKAKAKAWLTLVTDGKLNSFHQSVAMKPYFANEHNIHLPNLKKETVEKYLKENPDIDLLPLSILERKLEQAKASSAKIKPMIRMAGFDGRARGTTLFCGAHTRRWSGKLIQVQNMLKACYDEGEFDIALEHCRHSSRVNPLGHDPQTAASKCTRGLLTAAPGKRLIGSDFVAVENGGLAWLAGEEWVLEMLRNGEDLYVRNAVNALGIDPASVTKGSIERDKGKVIELACGYQGWDGALNRFAEKFGMPPFEKKEGEDICRSWRDAHPETVKLWAGLEKAAVSAVRFPGKTFSYSSRYTTVKYTCNREWLLCRLPSGGSMWYYAPKVQMGERYGKKKLELSYWGMQSKPGQPRRWQEIKTYGGALAENANQSICRDILVLAMHRLDDAGYPIVLHVHDEAVAEVEPGFGSIEEYNRLMAIPPPWADGLPIAVDTWPELGTRYRK